MRVVEVFHSIQGEGPRAGRPATFIRLAGCNLRCWFCDSKYAQKDTDGQVLDIVTLLDYFLGKSEHHMIVFTGGEPLLQQNDIIEFAHHYELAFGVYPNIWIETNGTVEPKKKFINEIASIFYVVSPKLGHTLAPFFRDNRHNVYYKYVIDSVYISHNYSMKTGLMLKPPPPPGCSKSKIFLMPVASTRKQLDENFEMVWDLAVKEGYSVSSRLHVLAKNDKRGV